MNSSQVQQALGKVTVFDSLTTRERAEIAKLFREEWFNPGEDIVTEGERDGRFFLLTQGRAKVIVGGRTRRTLGPDTHFGEISLIDSGERSATIRAETQVRVLVMTSKSFMGLLKENWAVAKKVIAALCGQVRRLERSPTLG